MSLAEGVAAAATARRRRAVQVAADLLDLTKPKVQSLLLLITVFAMYIAGNPSPLLVLATCLGGYLSAGAAGAFNHVLDRDIDRLMRRTANRPLPSGRLSPQVALAFACCLSALSVVELTLLVNPLAAALSFGGLLAYVLLYTVILKRRTPQNIVWGGVAGAVPPLVGFAAVKGAVTPLAFLLFLIVFFWTPPHFWSLSLLMREEYARAGVPMLPVVEGERETRRQILLYTVLLYMITQLPFCAGALGPLYLACSMVLGGLFILGAWRLYRAPEELWRRRAIGLYLYSLAYLALLFGAMVVDLRI